MKSIPFRYTCRNNQAIAEQMVKSDKMNEMIRRVARDEEGSRRRIT